MGIATLLKFIKIALMMLKYSNIYVLGTSHIAVQSIKEVEGAFSKLKPGVLALELDASRLHSLLHNEKHKIHLSDIPKFGIKGFMFNLVGAWIERKLGKAIGTKPGDEMKRAIMLARENKIPVALIDQDITITLKRLSSRLTWGEKFRFIKEALSAGFLKKNSVKIDLHKVPPEKLIRDLTAKIKKDYPSMHLTLIEERNAFMAKNLYNLSIQHPDKVILAIVGAGHTKEIIEIVKCLKQQKKKSTS